MLRPVIIAGGGLAGLHAARLLQREGIGFLLCEARPRLGGRILTVDGSGAPSTDGFDLGPSWFWPGTHPSMARLVAELGLAAFAQHRDGDAVFQRMSREVQRYRGMHQQPPSMRVVGGTAAIVTAIAATMPAECVSVNARLTHLKLIEDGVEARVVDGHGTEEQVCARHVILALPPRLLEATVSFSPAVDAATASRRKATPTWMAPHAKFFALYARPFWRELALSGTAQSMVGPLAEIHDATTASGGAALFGFVGIPAAQRTSLGEDAIRAAALRQLVELFGPQAAEPQATLFKDWAADPLTATDDDWADAGHPVPDGRAWITGEWRDRVSLAGSETSESEPGYLAGAVDAAERAVAQVKAGNRAASR